MFLYTFFWVIPRRQNELCRRFGTLCQVHLERLDEDDVSDLTANKLPQVMQFLLEGSMNSVYFFVLCAYKLNIKATNFFTFNSVS
jgi:hypothetical protein